MMCNSPSSRYRPIEGDNILQKNIKKVLKILVNIGLVTFITIHLASTINQLIKTNTGLVFEECQSIVVDIFRDLKAIRPFRI